MVTTDTDTVVRPHATAWGSVLSGWLASVGMTALLAPVVTGAVLGGGYGPNDIAAAVPPIMGVMISYLVGGYVAGRMAGYRTSWHGMLSAFFGLFVVLATIVLGLAADRGVFGDLRLVPVDSAFPWAFSSRATAGDALAFGAILGFLATIFAGWLGGLLAPERLVAPVPAPGQTAPERTTTVRREPQPRFRFLPSAGRKGGERVERMEREEREERVERRDIR